jgi:hypothetical protein
MQLSSLVDLLDVAGAAVAGIFGAFFLIAVAIFIVGVGNRSDPDPRGSRPMAAYYFSGAFFFLWVTLAGLVIAFDSLIQLVGKNPSCFGCYQAPGTGPTNDAIRDCVLGALIVVFAGGALALHLRRGNLLADTEEDLSGPTKRVMRSYVALVSLIAIIIFVFAFISALWGVCELISPTIFGATGTTTQTVRTILDALVLVVLSGAAFSYHQRFAPSQLRLLGMVGSPHHLPTMSPPPPPV